jgi:hypothetical protein
MGRIFTQPEVEVNETSEPRNPLSAAWNRAAMETLAEGAKMKGPEYVRASELNLNSLTG